MYQYIPVGGNVFFNPNNMPLATNYSLAPNYIQQEFHKATSIVSLQTGTKAIQGFNTNANHICSYDCWPSQAVSNMIILG